jgi:hypothetical protein
VDYGRLFTASWQLTWRCKFLWLFGFLAGMSALSSSLLRLTLGPHVFSSFTTNLEEWRRQPTLAADEIDRLLQQIAPWLVSSIIVLTILSLASWLIILFAQGAIIGTAVDFSSGRLVNLGLALKRGLGLLGRFIALDTLIYFPLFLAVLLIMLIFLGALVGMLVSTVQAEATPASLLTPLLIGSLCILPLLCLLIPLGLITAAFRAVAFRDTAVLDTGIRQAVRHTWSVLKQNLGTILVLGVLVWGLQAVIDLALRILIIPVYGLVAAPGLLALIGESSPATVMTLVSQSVSIVLELFILFVQAIVYTFTTVIWTLAYMEISGQSSADQ